MSDGPLKNSQLGSRWKRFLVALDNEAVDGIHRIALASDALVHEILNDDTRALLKDLSAFMHRDQLALDTHSEIDSIFAIHTKTAFGDELQREVGYRLADQMTLGPAIRMALMASLKDHIRRVRSRIQEELIRAQEAERMSQDQFAQFVRQADEVFDVLDTTEICDAIEAVDPQTFRDDASKQDGIDEGPSI